MHWNLNKISAKLQSWKIEIEFPNDQLSAPSRELILISNN